MSEIRNDRNAVLALLAQASQTTAPVQIQLNWVTPSGVVDHDYILVRQAPASVLTRVIKECVMVSLSLDGLLIPLKD
jgi:hypothetical protein